MRGWTFDDWARLMNLTETEYWACAQFYCQLKFIKAAVAPVAEGQKE